MKEIVLKGAKKNALGSPMLRFLLEELRSAGGGPVLLTGAGDAFSAGLDLNEVLSFDPSSAESFLRLLEECVAALYLYPGPTVAAVNGHAIAGGCVLTLCCDHRVVTTSPTVKVGLNEVPLGLRFPPRIFAVVRSRVPRHHLERIVLGGSLFAPADALRLGLVDELDDDPHALARRRIAELAASPPAAYARAKRDLRGSREQDLAPDAALDVWMQESLPAWTSDELKANVASALRR